MRQGVLHGPRVSRARLARWCALYLAVGGLIALVEPSGGQAAWYPPIAVGVLMLLTLGLRVWPLVVVLDVVISFLQYDLHLMSALISGSVTAVEVLLVAWLLHRVRFDRTFERVEDVALMGGVGAVGALAAATVGTALMNLVVPDAPGQWSIRVIGDLSGLTIALPLLAMLTQERGAHRRLFRVPVRKRAELAVVGTLSLATVFAYFARFNPGEHDVAASGVLLLCLLPVFWFSVRFGRLRTAAVIVLVDVTASLAYTGLGPHLFTSGVPDGTSWDMVVVQVPMFALSLAAFGVAVAVAAQHRASAREQALLASSPVGIVALDRHGVVTSWNRAAERIFGYTAEESIGRVPPMIGPADRERFRVRFTEELRHSVEELLQYRRKDGAEITARLSTSPLVDGGGNPYGVIGVVEDVTEMMAMQAHQALLTTAIDQAAETIVVTDLDGTIIYANPAATVTTGYSADEVIGQNPRMFKSGLHDDAYYVDLWETITNGGTWQGVMVNKRKNGELFHEQVGIRPVHDAKGTSIAYVAVKHDLTHQRQLEQNLERDRRTRAAVMDVMEHVRAGETVAATADALAKGIVEVTNFDLAVVLLRHIDGALLAVGEAGPLMATRRGRIIGEHQGAAELLALTGRSAWWTPTKDPTVRLGFWADSLSTELIESVAFAPMRWGADVFGVLMVASRDSDSREWVPDELPMLAEVASFGAVLVGSQAEKEQWNTDSAAATREIIEHHRFHPVFQPIVELSTGAVVGYEALTRFDDGTRPDWKIRDAWLSGVGIELEVALAQAALDVAAELLPPNVHVSLNFSPETILDGSAANLVRDANRTVLVEVTEHTPIDDYAALRKALHECGQRVKVSVDDAGAGFASLRHILELEPDVVKLDIALIHGIDGDVARQALTAGLCHYAEQTGTRLIAEGVETASEAAMVQALGVHWAQGFHFGRPTPRP